MHRSAGLVESDRSRHVSWPILAPGEIFMQERRSSPRWPFRCDLLCGVASALVVADPCNLSESGIAFKTVAYHPVGTELTMCLALQDGSAVNATAVVRRREGTTVGAEFVKLRVADRLKLIAERRSALV